MTDFSDIITRLKFIKPGERVVYYTGFIAMEDWRLVRPLQQAAWDAYERGAAILMQRYIGSCLNTKGHKTSQFEYIAIGRSG